MNPADVNSVLTAIRGDLEIYIFSISFVFIGLLFLLLYSLIRQGLQQFLSFSVLAIASGVSLFQSATSYPLIIGSSAAWVEIFNLAYYLMPVGIIAFLETVLEYEPRLKKIISLFWKVFLAHAVIMGLLSLLGICSASVTIEVFTTFFILSIFPMFKTKKYQKGSPSLLEARIIMVGATASGLTGLFDMLQAMLSFHVLNKPTYHWGMLVLILSFMLSLMQKFKTTHLLLKQRSEELHAKNISLTEAWKELDELNKNLEKRVEDRTEQLKNANEELLAINDNLTETMLRLTETQAQLVQSEKMSALGSLVAGITHEINTPIGTIKSNIQLEEMLYSQVDQQDAPSMRDYMEKIPVLRDNNIVAADRISGIVHDLKNFARLDESELKIANINDGIESTLSLINYKLQDKNIRVNKDLKDLPEIMCVPKQINQLILILLENAIDAVKDNGDISISTEASQDNIITRVSDTGCGIFPENLSKIFNPGYTTKGVGVGTGLGLAIAYKIVEQHQGKIGVRSELAKGTEFTIEIPIRPKK